MSVEQDDKLLQSLRAFGDTLEATTGESIKPPSPSLQLVETEVVPPKSTTTVKSNPRRGWLLGAVAAGIIALALVASNIGTPSTSQIEVGDSVPSTASSTTVDDNESSGDESLTERSSPATTSDLSTIRAADGTALYQYPSDLEGPEVEFNSDYGFGLLLDDVRQELYSGDILDDVGIEITESLRNDGLQIFTTIDPKAQLLAQESIADEFPVEQRNGFEAYITTIDSRTGAVTAIARSSGDQEPFNVATKSLRQPGSAFKPIVLAALFEAGYHPTDLVRADGPCAFDFPDGSYMVGGSERGVATIEAVTRSSNNCAFVRLGQAVGNDKVANSARKLGISSMLPESKNFGSLPLGSMEVSQIELTAAYAAFANGGKRVDPWFIDRVEDRDGNVLFQRLLEPVQVLEPQTAAMISSVLESNVKLGTGKRAELDQHQSAGKTGTTQNFTDAWYVGYTGRFTTSVWVGNPSGSREIQILGQDGTPQRPMFGGELPASLWGAYMNELHGDFEPGFLRTGHDKPNGEPRLLEAENETS